MSAPSGREVELLRSFIEQTTQYAVYVLDTAGLVRFWNSGAERLFGFSADEMVGQHIRVIYREVDRRAQVPEADLHAARSEGSSRERRWMVRNDGIEMWVEGMMRLVSAGPGSEPSFGGILRDASDDLRLEQRLERANDELHRFVFTVSHDLKEPLRTVRNYSELLQRRYKGKLDADADEFIGFLIEGSNRMGQLLNDILAYSQAGREDRTRPEPTDTANILQWALMNLDPIVKQNDAAITYDSLPRVLVDQTQFASVFQHVLGNALKFRGDQPPRIHISARPVGEHWEFSIQDNGPGVPADQTERIFGLFKRLVPRTIPGTGVGLSISRKIIEAHGGKMWLESREGAGATVKFTLPAA